MFQGVGHTLPIIARERAESDAGISGGRCKCLLFMYVSVCAAGMGDESGILTGVITNCTVSAIAAAKVEENFMILD